MSIEVTNLISPFIQAYKNINDEWNHFFEIGLEEYLHSQAEKYYFTNTFLHRHELIKFTDFYYPVKIQYDNYSTDLHNPFETFKKHRFLMIIGSAGSGKSTLTKYLYLNSIFQNFKIPLLVELRHLNDFDGDLEKIIIDKIIKTRAIPSERILKRVLKQGDFLILLDGYDEIFYNKKQKVNAQIESFIDSYSKNCFVITTRPGAGIEGFNRFANFEVLPLSIEDIENFVLMMVKNEERKQRLLLTIKDVNNDAYIHYLRNPLLLSMFILAFETHPEIPDKKSAFYKNVFDTLYSKHDGITKNSFPREKITKLQRDDFENILGLFSYLSLIDKQISFTEDYIDSKLNTIKKYYKLNFKSEDLIYDLSTSISIFVKEGFEFKFPHRSMQEFFSALFISKLPTEKKEKAYENLMQVIENESYDNSFNLEEICMEIDYFPFISFFLIPKLKNIYEKFDAKDDRDLITRYFKLIDPLAYKFSGKYPDEYFKIYKHSNYTNSLFSYFKIYNYSDTLNFLARTEVRKELDLYLLAKPLLKKDVDGINLLTRPVLNILLKTNFVKVVEDVKASLLKKIISLEKSIIKQNKNIDNLLF
jgi:energy-coupling factor transporter ATP-binding protein EcfA2